MTAFNDLPRELVQEFEAALRGELLRPGDEGYDSVRKVWNGMIDHRPALIVRCAGVADVIAAVKFAPQRNLLVSVRGGGHNIAGKAVCDGGLMIDLSPMKGIHVDPVGRTARAEGGVTLGELDHETQAFGLATTVGIVPTTGIAGLTLGGGVGRIGRKYGLACDNLLSVDLVTADGRFLRASISENADLFWGVRGGGGNFGIVTSFEYRLHPVGPVVLGGPIMYPLQKAREGLKLYTELTRAAPDELAADALLVTAPDGERILAIAVCYIGPIEHGRRILEPLRKFGPPVSDQIGPIAYAQLQASGEAFFPTGLHYYWKTHFLTNISAEAIDAVVAHFSTVPSPRSVVGFQQYGGAISRVGRAETAFWHRDAQYDFLPVSIWSDPAESSRQIQWIRQLWDLMQPFARGVYVNNLGEEGEDQVRVAYGDNYDRLVALKTKYDPTNFFRLNSNIRPTG
ncbi:MAG TPA: FAD-binding oxidoreductase [Chloroflexota bacterium]|nr:FAD-binding oxidoreductase [Chloroflexota bacterium]